MNMFPGAVVTGVKLREVDPQKQVLLLRMLVHPRQIYPRNYSIPHQTGLIL